MNLFSPPGEPRTPYGKNEQMHPHDLRNMFIFFVLAAMVYFSYDSFVLQPQREAIKVQQKLNKEIQSVLDEAPAQAVVKRERSEILADVPRLQFSNKEIKGTIDLNSGGRIDDLSLKRYHQTIEDEKLVTVLNPKGSVFPRGVEYGWLSASKAVSVPGNSTQWQIRGNQTLKPGSPITMVWSNATGLRFERTIAVDENFMFTVTQRAINEGPNEITLYPYGLISQNGIPEDYNATWISHEGPVAFIGEELFNDGYSDLRKQKKQSFQAEQGWLGITDKYWLTAMIPPQGEDVKYSYSYAGAADDEDNDGLYQADFLGAAVAVPPGGSAEVQSQLFVGAKEVLILKDYEEELSIPQFDLAVDFGWFWFMTKPFFYIMHYLHMWIGNMGIAIIVMTIMIRGAVFPLTNTSYRSFANMKKISPIVQILREKYGDDKQKMQEELIKMYQKEGVNPMSGCLPMLVQIPIFFALYKTFYVTIELRHEPFFGWIQDMSAPDPTSVFNGFGLIPWDPPSFLMIGAWPCLMLLIMIVQKKLNPPPTDPMQRDMMNFMPFLFAFIMSQFAAGLVVYWTFSALIGVIQQAYIMRSLGVPIHLFGESHDDEEDLNAEQEAKLAEYRGEFIEDEEEANAEPKEISPPKPKKKKKKK